MYKVFTTWALAVSGALGLSACSATIPQYETISSTAATTSTLGGTALRFSLTGAGDVATSGVTGITGSVTHNTGSISIDDGIYLLVDPNGFDANGQVTDGVNTGRRIDGAGINPVFSNVYDYVIPFEYSYSNGGTSMSVGGTAGIVTRTADVPTAGTAQYTGEAFARTTSSDGLTDFFYFGGISIVDVDFAAGSVDVTMGLFTDIQQTGTSTVAPIDAISGTGMAIVGASFTGGTWATLKNGVIVNITGAASVVAGGNFYGYDASISAPDEVGGVILINGVSGRVYGIYIAD